MIWRHGGVGEFMRIGVNGISPQSEGIGSKEEHAQRTAVTAGAQWNVQVVVWVLCWGPANALLFFYAIMHFIVFFI